MQRVLLCLGLLLLPAFASAHGGQPSLEKTVGPYLVDIGFDRIGMRPGEEVTFDFDLFTATGALNFVKFTNVNVEFATKDGVTVHEQVVENEEVNVPSMKYTFNKAGTYVMHVTYMRGDEQIVYTTFELPVGTTNGGLGRFLNLLTYITAGVLVAFGLVIIFQSLLQRRL